MADTKKAGDGANMADRLGLAGPTRQVVRSMDVPALTANILRTEPAWPDKADWPGPKAAYLCKMSMR